VGPLWPDSERVKLTIRRPGTPLSKHVEYLWMIGDAPVHALERIVPTGTLELVVNLATDEINIYDDHGRVRQRLAGAVVSGVYRRAFVVDTRAHVSMVGAHFWPGGAGAVLGVPPGALADRHVALSDLWAGSTLREQLCGARDPLALLETLLVAHSTTRASHAAIPPALAMVARAQPIGDIAQALGLSRRRLIEVFTADVGITPKRMSRVLRLQRALALAGTGTDWGRTSHASGYYDQAHLIRDCNEIAGMSPSELVRASAGVKPHHAIAGSNSSNPRASQRRTLSACARSS
jgi:AraC-like DNA-binding protein